MKTIDEFATEYAQDKYMPIQTSQAVKAGADYVISEIMDCFPHTLCMNPNEVISSIVTTINELRK